MSAFEDEDGIEAPWNRAMDEVDTQRCECCQSLPGCGCEIDEVAGTNAESGPWEEAVCYTHRRRV